MTMHILKSITISYTNPINVSVGVHRGSLLSSPPFIIVMKPLSREFRTCCPWILYTDGLVIVAELLGELKIRLKFWKDGLKDKEIKVNVGKYIKELC